VDMCPLQRAGSFSHHVFRTTQALSHWLGRICALPPTESIMISVLPPSDALAEIGHLLEYSTLACLLSAPSFFAKKTSPPQGTAV
jgi:hypothetical protein